MAAQGSGGYGGPQFAQVENNLRNIALQFSTILSLQQQIAASVNAWRMLERETALARAAAGGTRAEFEQMITAARNFALAATYSAGQVANAFYNLASAGLSVKETLQAATGVILLAQATLTDLGEASDVVASAMAQFNLTASESFRISNLFVASTNTSLSTVAKLSYALRQVGPIAAQSNLSLEQTVGILDKLFDAGLRGEQAGTALRNSMVRLLDPVGEGQLLLQGLGVSTIDKMTGEVKQFIPLMKELAALNLSSSQVVQIFGTEAAAGAISIMSSLRSSVGETNTELEKHIAEISNTTWAYRQAVVQMNTLDGALSLAANNFNELRIIIGQGLAPMIISLSYAFGDFVASLKELSTEQILSYVHTGLMLVQFGAVYKILTLLHPTALTLGKALANIGVGAQFYKTINATDSLRTRMLLASEGAGLVSKGLMGIASTALGLVGVGIAIYGIAEAMNAVAEAEKKARIEKVLKRALEQEADDRGLTGQARADFIDRTDASKEIGRRAGELNKLFAVDERTGSGATQALQARAELLRKLEDDLKRYAEQYSFLTGKLEQLRPQREKFSQALREEMTSSFFGNLGLATEVDIASQKDDYFSKENLFTSRADARRAQEDYVNGVLSSFAAFASREDIIAYYDQQEKELLNSNLAGSKKLIERVRKTRETIRKFDDNAIKTIIEVFNREGQAGIDRAASGELASDFVYIGDTEQTGNLAQTLNAIGEGIVGGLAQAEEEARAEAQRIMAATQRTIATMQKLQGEMSVIGAKQSSEIVNFVMTAGDLTAAEIDQLNAYIASPAGQQALKETIKIGRENNLSVQQQADELINLMMKDKFKLAEKFSKFMKDYAATPIIDRIQMARALRASEIEHLKLRLDILKLTKGPADEIKALQQEIIQQTNTQSVSNTLAEFAETITKGSEQAKVNFDRISEADKKQLQTMLEGAANSRGYNEQQITAINEFLRKRGIENADIGLAIRNAARQLQIDKDEKRKSILEMEKDLAADTRSQIRTDPVENYINDLLGLPTPEEQFIAAQRLRIAAKYAIAEYLDMPLEGVNREIEEAQLELRAKQVEIREKFRKVFADTLAKGADGVSIDMSLQEAFSGQFYESVLEKGEGEILGTKFTREALKTTEGMQKFVDLVIGKFSEAVKGSPAANERIQAARNQIIGMLNEINAVNSQFASEFAVLNLKQEQIRNQIREATFDFEANNIIAMFQEAITTNSALSPEKLTLDIEVALQAEVVKVQLNAEEAIRKVREEYQAHLANMGIPVSVRADGSLALAGGSGAGIVAANVSNAPREIERRVEQAVEKFMVPFDRGVTSVMGTRRDPFTGRGRYHGGIDYAKPAGTPIEAPLSGTVAFAGQKGGYGNTVIIDHGGGLRTLYAHMSEIGVKMGEAITQGAVLGKVGSTGRSTGNHLHMEAELNGRRVDPRSLAGKTYGVTRQIGGGSEAVLAAEEEVKLTADQEKQFEAINKLYEQRIELIRKGAQEQVDFITDEKNATIIAQATIAKARQEVYEQTQGVVDAELIRQAELAADRARAVTDMFAARLAQTGNPEDVADLRYASIQEQRAENELERTERIVELRKRYNDLITNALGDTEEQNRLRDEQLRLEGAINDEINRRNELTYTSIDIYRRDLQRAAEQLQQYSGSNGGNRPEDIMLGARHALMLFASEVPTVFETMSQVVSDGLSGLASSIADVFIGADQSVRKSIASILQQMAKLIMQMLIMKAIMSVVGLLSGGFASGAAAGVTAAGNAVGNAAAKIGASSIGSFAGLQFAEGGIGSYDVMSEAMRRLGGIRSERNPALAMFGEGSYPEAYIPMLDRKSIPVRIGKDGRAYVPLPSGQHIPVTMKKYAKGGIGNAAFMMNTQAADAVTGGMMDAVSPYRRNANTSAANVSTAYNIDLGGITINGNASAQDAQVISEEVIKQVLKMLEAREEEKARATMMRQDNIASMYGVTG